MADIIRSAEQYMREEVMVKDKYDSVRGDCRLRHRLCAFWASIGECDANANYMGSNCAPVCSACGKTFSEVDASPQPHYDWDSLLRTREPILATGNIWPPSVSESAEDCLLLLTHTRIIRYCPSNGPDGESVVLYTGVDQRFRGAFAAASGTDRRRLWLLTSPYGSRDRIDVLQELDVLTGKIVQNLTVPISIDGHDAVRVGDRVFIVDTRGGNVIEMALPASAAPYTESSVKEGGATIPRETGMGTLIRRHTGHTRADHINNVAVHPDVLLLSVHGDSAIKKRVKDKERKLSGPSITRLSGLVRLNGTESLMASVRKKAGRELSIQDGFTPVVNAGTWCHNMAFWEEPNPDGKGNSKIKLITLDSKMGSLVSIVLSGPGSSTHERKVIWAPDTSHPILTPPSEIPSTYQGAKVFAKGLALQGNVAYFGLSYARAPPLRRTIPYSLFIAVNLVTGEEVFSRTIRSNGLINQVVTESYLGHPIRVPRMILVRHGNEHQYAGYDIKMAQKVESAEQAAISQSMSLPLSMEDEAMMVADEYTINETVIFPLSDDNTCLDEHGMTLRLSLVDKQNEMVATISDIDSHLDRAVLSLCRLDVSAIERRLHDMGDNAFSDEGQRTNAKLTNIASNLNAKMKPYVNEMKLISSNRSGREVYHFPWLDEWIPLLKSAVIDPLQINIGNIVRLQFANMTAGSAILPHSDKGPWVSRTHRIYIPIITHPNTLFMMISATRHGNMNPEIIKNMKMIRIKSGPGDVFELNNAMTFAVANRGGDQVHLIIDWAEEPAASITKLKTGDECEEHSGEINSLYCDSDKASNLAGAKQGEL